ncbi:MAG: methylenetetrahydrofolate--tRNA-(uracil(54)-C(5))-methyltransferase (FADH(2)-oxidizing) TrmFO [Pseudomonadota bacterium]
MYQEPPHVSSDDALNNAVGLIHAEMRMAGSLIMRCADATQVPAGSALAVDREAFSAMVTKALAEEDNIEIVRGEVTEFPPEHWGPTIVATGPLTGPGLAEGIAQRTGGDALAFFDAIAPIVHFDSINMDVAWFQSRYDKVGPGGTGADYINCPMDRDQYEAFVGALIDGPKTEFKEWEGTPYFEGCMPVEVMAERGRETLRHGPMKPMGLTNRHKPDEKAYAVVQLRQDNALGTLYNMVGFQTKLRYGAQADIFRTIPGLEYAEFARLGGLHRNTYLDSPRLLSASLQLEAEPRVRFAGQMTGCEGYVESAAVGLMAGRFMVEERAGLKPNLPPATTAMGALLAHITGGHIAAHDEKKRSFQPMNVNFGLFPPVETPPRPQNGKRYRGKEKTIARKQALARRALVDASQWLGVAAPDIEPETSPEAA